MLQGLNLIAEINDFLDNIRTPQSTEEILENIDLLRGYTTQMKNYGFENPYKESLSVPKNVLHEDNESQLNEISKQIKIMKYVARLKKITLNRTKVSLASHLIGLSFIEKKELYNYLVFDGNYVNSLSKAGIEGYSAFQKINELLCPRETDKWVVATIAYYENGKKEKTTVRLDVVNKKTIKEIYGKDAEIVKTQIVKKKGIIKNTSSRIAIGVIFSHWAADKIKTTFEISDDDEVNQYNTVLAELGFVRDIIFDSVEGREEIKNELIKKGFVEKIGEEFVTKKELKQKIASRRRKRNAMASRKALSEFLRLMYNFYIKNTKPQRIQMNFCPSLSIEPEEEVVGIFDELKTTHNIENAGGILSKKFELEKNMPKGFDSLWGVAYFIKETGKDIEWCEKFFDIPKSEINQIIGQVESITTNRGGEFIKMLRGR
ncbi:DUF530 family protein [Candidatus Micrarchaeota archaeon]|nr:DUF530 family protein [Candidatus Micrarchaeota archaeon]